MATHWSSCEVPKGARMISGASTMLTLAEKERWKNIESGWAMSNFAMGTILGKGFSQAQVQKPVQNGVDT